MKTLPADEAVRLDAAMMSERDFQKQVIELARALGWHVAHFRPGMTSRVGPNGKPIWVTPMQGDPGFFDLVLARMTDIPRLILVELKSEAGKETAPQLSWKAALGLENLRDWEVYLWRPSDMAEIVKTLA